MASLQVGDVVFHFATVRTEQYTATPVMDPSGRHFEMTQIDLAIIGVVNAVSIASNKAAPGAIGAGNEGDSLPRTLWELENYLMVPRRRIVYQVAGVTILDLPQLGNNVRLNSDPKGGPFPKFAKFTKFTGDKSAILQFSVTCHDSRSNKYTLSHAWDVSSSIDERGYSTRRITGRAAFRKDFLDFARIQPDDFRRALFPPCPQGMRRVDVQVAQPRTADEVNYSVVDREVTFGLGERSEVTEVRGTVTATTDTMIKTPKDFFGGGVKFLEQAFQQNYGDAIEIGLNVAVPTSKATGVARVYGRKGCNRNNLAVMGKSFIIDRLRPSVRAIPARFAQLVLGGPGVFFFRGITGASVTHNFDSDLPPFAEVRLDLFMPLPWLTNIMFIEGRVFNLANVYFSDGVDDFNGGGQAVGAEAFAAPALTSGNSRGTWLERMVSQTLLSATQADANTLPPAPPAAQGAVDFANLG